MSKIKYYDIDESAAESAKRMNSFYDYKKGSETEGYKEKIKEIYNVVDNLPEIAKEKGYKMADRYAKLYAANINKRNRIKSSVPSILIAGPAGVSPYKKEKQNARYDAAMREWQHIDDLESDIRWLKHYKPRVEKQGKEVTNGYDFDNEFFEVVQNVDENRIQLIFEGKPDEETRSVLKEYAFRWSPRNNAWQRQLTANGRIATTHVISKLRELNVGAVIPPKPSKKKRKEYEDEDYSYTPYMTTRSGKTIYAKDYGKKAFKIGN